MICVTDRYQDLRDTPPSAGGVDRDRAALSSVLEADARMPVTRVAERSVSPIGPRIAGSAGIATRGHVQQVAGLMAHMSDPVGSEQHLQQVGWSGYSDTSRVSCDAAGSPQGVIQ